SPRPPVETADSDAAEAATVETPAAEAGAAEAATVEAPAAEAGAAEAATVEAPAAEAAAAGGGLEDRGVEVIVSGPAGQRADVRVGGQAFRRQAQPQRVGPGRGRPGDPCQRQHAGCQAGSEHALAS